MQRDDSRVVVVGGGLAGLAAGLQLVDAGCRVTLLERLGVPGGRVRGIRGPQATPLDGGQHLLLGAYHAVRRLAARLGTAADLRFVESETPFVSAPGRIHPYRVGPLPAPLHALPALLGPDHLAPAHRLGLGLAVAAGKIEARLRPRALDRLDAAAWLRARGQSEAALRGFWEPLITATCNARPEETSAALLAAVIDRGLLASREDALPMLPVESLHRTLVLPAVRALREAGGEWRTGTEAVALETGPGGRVRAVHTARGDRWPAEAVVLAVPSWSVGPLLGNLAGTERIRRDAEWLGAAPIVTVEAWFDRAWMPWRFAGLLEGAVQWAFAHRPGQVTGAAQRVSMVTSRSDRWAGRPPGEIAREALADLGRMLPASAGARVVAVRVWREPRATFLGRPGQAVHRPPTRTPVPNLFLAGDWTATGLPATLEGAVRSGRRAAAEALGFLRRGAPTPPARFRLASEAS